VNVEIGTKAAQFPEKEYINGISLQCKRAKSNNPAPIVIKMTFGLGRVAGDSVEYVDQHEKQGDQQRHPSRDHVRRNYKADPGHNNK
jgi:hypothetical protein